MNRVTVRAPLWVVCLFGLMLAPVVLGLLAVIVPIALVVAGVEALWQRWPSVVIFAAVAFLLACVILAASVAR